MFPKITSVIVVLVFVGASAMPALAAPVTTPLTNERIQTILKDGSAFLQRAQEKNGHFNYEYVPYEGRYRKDDNIVRQAGAFFELSELERFDIGSTYNFKKNLVKSADYFTSLTVSGTYNGTTLRCIKEENSQTCKLGTTALALIGLLNTTAEYPELRKKYEPLMKDYATYIVAMKKENKGYRYYFRPAHKTQKDDESSFSNGEAYFALVRYDARYPNDTTKKILKDTFTYLEKTHFDAPLYLWVMAGIKDLPLKDVTPAHIAYAQKYTAWRLADNAKYRNSTQNRCAYIEGLTSAYSILEGKTSVAEQKVLKAVIDDMLAQTALLQVSKDVPLRYVMGVDGKGEFMRLRDPKLAHGGFLTGSDKEQLTQRIDYTQHCLSAYAQTLVDIRGGVL